MYPEANIILAGDFNFVMTDSDAVNRASSNTEIQCRNFFKRNLARLNLRDSFRQKHDIGGYTWSRGNCMSRLDMIFVSEDLSGELVESKVDWVFDDSDHARLESVFKLREVCPLGPGLVRINADILDDKLTLEEVKMELNLQLQGIPNNWDPHFKLNFVKTAIRSIISHWAGKKLKKDNLNEQAITEQLKHLYLTKEKMERGEIVNPELLVNINSTITILETEHRVFLDERAKYLSIRAKAKWYEEGERSNKYFLNIIKKRSEQTTITKLRDDNEVYESQNDIMKHVTTFYQDLYNEKETDDNCDILLSDSPKINDEDRQQLDRDITLEELRAVVNTCGDSAPGPDGIPHKVYRQMWDTLGPYLLDA